MAPRLLSGFPALPLSPIGLPPAGQGLLVALLLQFLVVAGEARQHRRVGRRRPRQGHVAALAEPAEVAAVAGEGLHLLAHRRLLAPAAAHQSALLPQLVHRRRPLALSLSPAGPFCSVAAHQQKPQQGCRHQARPSSLPHGWSQAPQPSSWGLVLWIAWYSSCRVLGSAWRRRMERASVRCMAALELPPTNRIGSPLSSHSALRPLSLWRQACAPGFRTACTESWTVLHRLSSPSLPEDLQRQQLLQGVS